MKRLIIFLAAFGVLAGFTGITGQSLLFSDSETAGVQSVARFPGSHNPVWNLRATKPLIIGGYGDNFNYDGSRVRELKGEAIAELNTEKNTGKMEVVLNGTINPEKGKFYTGEIQIVYRIASEGPPFWEGGVADFVLLHGNTKQGPPVMPKVRAFVAAWGEADVYVDGKLIYEGLDGHMMYTERTRDVATRAIYSRDSSGFYSPKDPANFSIADPNGREIHFVVHSNNMDKGNFPPHNVWIHLNFEEVREVI